MQQPPLQLGSDGSVPLVFQNEQLTVAQAQPTAPQIASHNNIQYLSIKQGDQVQQVPVIQQSPQLLTVPIQVPVAYYNGSPIFQTHHVPVQALQHVLQASASGEQLNLPQQNVIDIPSFLQNSVAAAQSLSSNTDQAKDTSASADDVSEAVTIKAEPNHSEASGDVQVRKSKSKVPESNQEPQAQQHDSLQQAILQADMQPTAIPTPQTIAPQATDLQFATNSIVFAGAQPTQTLQGVQIVNGSAANLVQTGVNAPIILQTINTQQVNEPTSDIRACR